VVVGHPSDGPRAAQRLARLHVLTARRFMMFETVAAQPLSFVMQDACPTHHAARSKRRNLAVGGGAEAQRLN
jgi:hypothetical protein